MPIACTTAPTAVATAVVESLHYAHYDVVLAGCTLADAIDRASPVRVADRVFHGHADWKIDWHFGWEYDAEGRCTIARRTVRLRSRIVLPRLVETAVGDALQRARFDRYLAALTEHEHGHVDIARRAAVAIDRHLAELPPMVSDHRFATLGNRGAQAILARHRALEKRYDHETGHGRTQGARLTA